MRCVRDETLYTFRDDKRDRWRRGAGLRIAHILLSPPLGHRLIAAGVDREVRGKDGASYHAPIWVLLDNSPPIKRKRQARPA